MNNLIVLILPSVLTRLNCIAMPDAHAIHPRPESSLFILGDAVGTAGKVKPRL